MIRMGLFLNIIIITITAGLFLTGDIETRSMFQSLPSQLNEFLDIGAAEELVVQAPTVVGSPDVVQTFQGLIVSTIGSGLAILDSIVTLLTGGIEIIELVDPGHTWGTVILVPLALFQVFYFVFMLIAFLQSLAALLRGLV